jgi:hypothetical protein
VRFILSLIILSLCAAGAFAVEVNVPTDDVSVNIGGLLQVGHFHRYLGEYRSSTPLDHSEFAISEAEFRIYGTLFERVDYDLRCDLTVRSQLLSSVREVSIGTALPAGFSVKIGRVFVPFGAEATTNEAFRTCANITASSSTIAPGRNDGVRFDYLLERDAWPYKIGAAAGVFDGTSPLMDGAGRIYGAPVPGLRQLELGASYYYHKTQRRRYGEYPIVNEEYFAPEPRAGGDLSFSTWRVTFAAEYMQRFVNDYPFELVPRREPYYGYKDTFHKGYFGTLTYTHPLPWEYFQDFMPYARYERWMPAVLERGDIAEDRYTAGFALHFLDRNLMFRSDYTRILEDEYPITNDRITSEFQVMF